MEYHTCYHSTCPKLSNMFITTINISWLSYTVKQKFLLNDVLMVWWLHLNLYLLSATFWYILVQTKHIKFIGLAYTQKY